MKPKEINSLVHLIDKVNYDLFFDGIYTTRVVTPTLFRRNILRSDSI